MKRIIIWFLFFAFLSGCRTQNGQLLELSEENLNFIVISDLWCKGKSEQKNIAKIMGRLAEKSKIDFIAVAGDAMHDYGNAIKSVKDKEWDEKIEKVYTASSLHNAPWYVISGNHEYHGNVQAVTDYSEVSGRWNAPARYFTVTQKMKTNENSCLFVFIDTTPLVSYYRKKYPEAGKQDVAAQIEWIETTLSSTSAKWKFVIGHHPVHAEDKNHDETQIIDMQTQVGVLLEKYEVDFYICGHTHNFQYINLKGVNYVVNSSASSSRPVSEIEGMLFCNNDPGFTVFTISPDSVKFSFINHSGKTLYSQTVNK